jgi:inhibitor of cysteine peptidase
MVVLDERANGSRVELRPGAAVVLRLDENPTTGYRWQVDSSGAPVLALQGDQYEAPPRSKAGAPGQHVWSFRAVAAGSGLVQLSYRRRFGGVARTFMLTADVRAA